jgi:hypothetical protein
VERVLTLKVWIFSIPRRAGRAVDGLRRAGAQNHLRRDRLDRSPPPLQIANRNSERIFQERGRPLGILYFGRRRRANPAHEFNIGLPKSGGKSLACLGKS